jgi:hypothetical protein
MKRLIFLFFFITHLVTAQIQEGQVYKIGDRFDSASCGTQTSFPRISRLVFFSKKTFLMYYVEIPLNVTTLFRCNVTT